MTLIETNAGETDAGFRTAMDRLLQQIAPDRPQWWHPYDVRGTYAYRGVRFRHVSCIAGSVEGWLWTMASKGGTRRVILLSDESARVFGPAKIYGRGEEVIISPDEVQAVRLAG